MLYKTEIPETDILPETNQRDQYRLPDHTRIMYASGRTIEYWKPKISFASREWQQIERLRLMEGLTDSILIYVAHDNWLQTRRWADKNDLNVVHVGTKGITQSYTSYGGNEDYSNGHQHRVAITRKETLVGEWLEAWENSDDIRVGELLGYPKCCQNFFDKYWNEQKFRDLTIPAIENGDGVDGVIESNILGRWAGIRWVSHMPCSFQCEASIKQGKQTRQLAIDHGKQEAADIIDRVLNMPVEYSCMHGIAEIVTPIYKISAASESLPKKYVARRQGTQPENAAKGNVFPFESKGNKLTETTSFKKSIDAAAQQAQAGGDVTKVSTGNAGEDSAAAGEYGDLLDDEKLWKLNGFSSMEAMTKSHDPIVKMVETDNVIDMGCGNGALLHRIRKQKGSAVTFGCDTDGEAIAYASKFEGIFFQQNMFDFDIREDNATVIFMAGRLTETAEETARKFMRQLADKAKFIIAYAYGDWKDRINIDGLVTRHTPKKMRGRWLEIESADDDHVTAVKFQNTAKI